MKRLTLAIGLVALVMTAAPALAARSRSGAVVTAAHRRPSGHFRHRPGWRFGFGWGWGYGYDPFWHDPWYRPYPGYYGYGRGYGYGYSPSRDWAVVDTDVSPESARLYLDGQYVGTADDFDGYPDYLYLRRGTYRLEFRLPGFQTRTIQVDARPGVKIDVEDKLARMPGAERYGSYDDPEPQGGVRRFWAKRRDVAQSVDENEIYGSGPRRYRERPRDVEDFDEYAEDRDRDLSDDAEIEREREPADERPAVRDEWRSRSDRADRGRESDTWLRLTVEPPDAAIYLDDRFIGTASELDLETGIALAPGRHALVVSRPGYRDRRIEVDVSRGETEKVEIKLER